MRKNNYSFWSHIYKYTLIMILKKKRKKCKGENGVEYV